MSESILIDDFGPLPVRRPASVAELCGLVKEAAASGQGVYPVGGRTTLDVGLPPIKPGFALDTSALNQVIDYPARDMTITVQAGITMAKLQATLAAEGQWLPVDVANPELSTIGGAIALNKSGPRRLGYGTLRDYVIGISFATDEGNEVKAGGRVVKNVAGYDLMKLQVGAIGTLGVITQLTLKVKPRPEASALVTFGCETADLAAILDLLHASKSRPCAVELLNLAAWRAVGREALGLDAQWILVVGFGEKAATVEWQVKTLLAELKPAPVRDVAKVCGSEVGSILQALTELQLRPESRFVWKASVLPSKVARLMQTVSQKLPYLSHAEAMNGVVWFHAPGDFELASTIDPKLGGMEGPITMAHGNYVMRRCPIEWKRRLRVWGRPGSDHDLMRHVKQTLDPQNVFNPGRLFGDM